MKREKDKKTTQIKDLQPAESWTEELESVLKKLKVDREKGLVLKTSLLTFKCWLLVILGRIAFFLSGWLLNKVEKKFNKKGTMFNWILGRPYAQ